MTILSDFGRATSPRRWPSAMAVAVAVVLLAACAGPRHRAPVEDRGGIGRLGDMPLPSSASDAATLKPLPGAENAGKPGYYTVRPGDTLIRVALENGQNWKDVVRWNALDNPNIIEVGQVLRVVPPGADPAAAGARPITAARVETRPLEVRVASSSAASAAVAATAAAPVAPVVASSPPAGVAREGDDDINWAWPAAGSVATPFDDVKSKGLAIAGKAGDPVLAAADGRVVYAGSSLRGYGNLIILKHNSTYLTAYAHNQALLVKEDQAVRRGQKIAEMGSTDADRVQLHFEIRKMGKPIDPAKLLPAR